MPDPSAPPVGGYLSAEQCHAAARALAWVSMRVDWPHGDGEDLAHVARVMRSCAGGCRVEAQPADEPTRDGDDGLTPGQADLRDTLAAAYPTVTHREHPDGVLFELVGRDGLRAGAIVADDGGRATTLGRDAMAELGVPFGQAVIA